MDRMVKNRPNILIFFTILAVGVSFAWLGVQDPSQWPAAVVLYMLGCECCPFFPDHFMYLCPSDILSGCYHQRLLFSLPANSLT
jgi:hypothetical protein